MSTGRQTPPPRLRSRVSARERALISDAVGPLADERLVRAVRDGRGREFQRLEFLGDSVLDLVLAAHRWVEPGCRACREAPQVASDRNLAEVARAAGLGAWLEWDASDDRIADLVETCVAASWRTGRWRRAVGFAARVVHPFGDLTVQLLEAGGQSLTPGREARRVGAAVLELAAAAGVFDELPLADEGELSRRRALLHDADQIAAWARKREGASGDVETVVSRVEDALAVQLADAGADAALTAARPLLSLAGG